jgi:hypothetical protein
MPCFPDFSRSLRGESKPLEKFFLPNVKKIKIPGSVSVALFVIEIKKALLAEGLNSTLTSL